MAVVKLILRLAASEVNQPGPRLDRDLRRAPRAWSVVKRRQDAKRLRALETALHRLVMHAQCATDREERRVLPVGKQHSGALDAPRRLASRLRYRPQLRRARAGRLPQLAYRHDHPQSRVGAIAIAAAAHSLDYAPGMGGDSVAVLLHVEMSSVGDVVVGGGHVQNLLVIVFEAAHPPAPLFQRKTPRAALHY
jgi:hypothetical protein